MTEIKIESLNQTVKVKKLALRDYVTILSKLESIPKQLGQLDSLEESAILANLPRMIAGAYPDFQYIINVATGIDKDDVDLITLEELIDIFAAILKENDFASVSSKVKKNIHLLKGAKAKA